MRSGLANWRRCPHQLSERCCGGYVSDVPSWLKAQGIEPTTDAAGVARRGLLASPAPAVRELTRSVVETASTPSYMEHVPGVLDAGIALDLYAGERSRKDVHVTDSVSSRAASMTVQPDVGHTMTLENPRVFLASVAALVDEESATAAGAPSPGLRWSRKFVVGRHSESRKVLRWSIRALKVKKDR